MDELVIAAEGVSSDILTLESSELEVLYLYRAVIVAIQDFQL